MNPSSIFITGLIVVCAIYAMQALSLNLKFGTLGLIDLGLVGYFAVGAYTYTLVTIPPPGPLDTYGIGLGWPLWAGFIIAPVVTGILAFLVGIPALRLQGDYLAIATFAFAEVVRAVFTNQSWLANGVVGFYNLKQPFRSLFDSSTSYQYFYMVLILVVLGALTWALIRFSRGPFGRSIRAIRENEAAALCVGKNVTAMKLKSFVLGGMIAGLAACFYVSFQGMIVPGMFVSEITWTVWIGLTIGGAGNYIGAIVGTFVLVGVQEATRLIPTSAFMAPKMASSRFMVMGLVLILIIRFRPKGILAERPWIDRSKVPAEATPTPEPVASGALAAETASAQPQAAGTTLS